MIKWRGWLSFALCDEGLYNAVVTQGFAFTPAHHQGMNMLHTTTFVEAEYLVAETDRSPFGPDELLAKHQGTPETPASRALTASQTRAATSSMDPRPSICRQHSGLAAACFWKPLRTA